MDEHKVLMAYDNCYFNNGCACVICGCCFESGGIEFGFKLIPNGKIDNRRAICPECMKKGPEGWKQTFLERARQKREYAKVAEQQALEEAAYYEGLANDTFILPTEEEEKAIRQEFPGEWPLTEYEEKPGEMVWHDLSVRGEKTGEISQVAKTVNSDVSEVNG